MLLTQVLDLLADFRLGVGVEAGRRLVEDQQAGLVQKGPRDRPARLPTDDGRARRRLVDASASSRRIPTRRHSQGGDHVFLGHPPPKADALKTVSWKRVTSLARSRAYDAIVADRLAQSTPSTRMRYPAAGRGRDEVDGRLAHPDGRRGR
jgi:hypothetical protein